ncbi:MAG: hypothetical protein IAE79_11895 [Anaerolinea sp.]|nr:hypothetical protein [Anaerolinea sp.]
MTPAKPYPLVLHADQEHARLRAVVTALILASMWLGYTLLYAIFQWDALTHLADYAVFLSCIGGVPLGLAAVWGIEKLLKRVWHSGRSVTLQTDAILVQLSEAEALRLEMAARVDVLTWYFRLNSYARGGSERRVAANWYCLAAQLQQDEQRVLVYTFMSPRHVDDVTQVREFHFHEIQPKDVYTRQSGLIRAPVRPEIPVEVLREKDGRFWLAEQRRWQDGLELTTQDFITLLRFVCTADE